MSTPTPKNATTMRNFVDTHNLKRMDILDGLKAAGVPISPTSLNRILNHGVWPTTIDRNKVRATLQTIFIKKGNKEEVKKMLEQAPANKKAKAVYGVGEILRKYGLTQTDAAKAVSVQGLSFSTTALSQLINHGVWPKTATPEQIIQPINAWLSNTATTKEIGEMWEEQTPTKNKKTSTKPTINFKAPEPEMLYQKTMQHFGLTRHPFQNEVETIDDLFMSQAQMRVRESMIQASLNGSILAVIGECGAGKTELRKGFYDYANKNHPELIIIEPMVIDKKRLTAGMIFDALAEELNISRLKQGLEHRARQVEKHLKQSVKAGNRHVLVIEEAHDLSNEAIKHLKRIFELSDGFNRLVGVVLVGQPELEVKLQLTNYDIREFSYRCNILGLPPLGLETDNYITHKFARCNVNSNKVITPEGIEALKQRLQGKIQYGQAKASGVKDMTYPLMVNTLLVKAMNEAASALEPIITDELVKQIK